VYLCHSGAARSLPRGTGDTEDYGSPCHGHCSHPPVSLRRHSFAFRPASDTNSNEQKPLLPLRVQGISCRCVPFHRNATIGVFFGFGFNYSSNLFPLCFPWWTKNRWQHSVCRIELCSSANDYTVDGIVALTNSISWNWNLEVGLQID